MAQKGQFSHIFVQNDGDTDVVAVVQGNTVTLGDIKKPAEFHRTVDPSLTEDESVKMVIVFVVDDRVLQAEVERRNLVPTDADTEAYMKPTKNACLGPNGQDCRDAIEELGYTSENYWAIALPEYKMALGQIQFFQAVFDEQGLSDADNEELITATDNYTAQLRSQATITWNDEDLKRLYEQAVADDGHPEDSDEREDR